jgi:hypothetical protein
MKRKALLMPVVGSLTHETAIWRSPDTRGFKVGPEDIL